MADDATVDARGMGPEAREWECGPYCALCGQCKACTDRGVQPDYGCYDRVEVDGSRAHLWPAGSPEEGTTRVAVSDSQETPTKGRDE